MYLCCFLRSLPTKLTRIILLHVILCWTVSKWSRLLSRTEGINTTNWTKTSVGARRSKSAAWQGHYSQSGDLIGWGDQSCRKRCWIGRVRDSFWWTLSLSRVIHDPSDQFQISSVSSPVILHHAVRITWLFIAYLDENDHTTKFSLHHLYISLQKVGRMYIMNLGAKGLIIIVLSNSTGHCRVQMGWVWDPGCVPQHLLCKMSVVPQGAGSVTRMWEFHFIRNTNRMQALYTWRDLL